MSVNSPSSVNKPAAIALPFHAFRADLVRCFQSVHLAIILLSLLAIGTIIGVVLPQEGMVELADIKQRYGTNFTFLHTMGFFNVFSSFWFTTLEILFFFNLLIGSFKWLKPATLAAIQKNTVTAKLILEKPEVHSLSVLASGSRESVSGSIRAGLKRFRYAIHQDAEGNLYASKGNLTRIGPSISHFGILLCLVAALYGNLTGFKAIRMAVPGETFAIQEADSFKLNMPEPFWMGSVPDWKIQVRDFRMEFYPDHPETVKQYYSKLRILSPEGKPLQEQTISVNHPLLFDNLSIYQASFAPTGRFFLRVNGQPVRVEINNQFNDRQIVVQRLADGANLLMFPFFVQQDPGVKENFAVFFLLRPGEKMPEGRMPDNIRLVEGQTGTLKGYSLTYERPEFSTGLQIKRAPEVPLMYLSYLIIAIGAALCFFSQRQLWVALNEVSPGHFEVLLYPKTNKARLSYRRELVKLQSALVNTLSHTVHPSQPGSLQPVQKEVPAQ